MEWKSLWEFVIYLSTLIRLMSVLCVTLVKVSETQCECVTEKGVTSVYLGVLSVVDDSSSYGKHSSLKVYISQVGVRLHAMFDPWACSLSILI